MILTQKITLVLPADAKIRPEDLLQFIEADDFLGDWQALALGEDELGEMQVALMSNPRRWRPMSGTGGLREAELRPDTWSEGRTLRVRYVWFQQYHVILLVAAFEGDPMPLSAADAAETAEMIRRERRQFARQLYRIG